MFRDERRSAIDPSPALPGAPSRDELRRWFDREFFDAGIDSDSCVPKWYAGDTIDRDLAIANMFQR